MALNVYVETAHSADALVVPVAALVDEDGRTIAFVQVSGETFDKRDLTLGMRDGAFVQVLAGLTAGERVVTKGAYAIRLASVSASSRPRPHPLRRVPCSTPSSASPSTTAPRHRPGPRPHGRRRLRRAAMPVDVFPDLTAPTVTVITEAHGMAPVEVETLVTFPIEASMNGAANVRRVRSATAVGISVVWVEFEWGTDIYAARQVVSEKLGLISGSLPPEVETPILAPISSIMGEILFLSLTSDRHTGIELRTAADTIIRRRLLSVPGVSQVIPIGGGEKQYQVVLSPSKLHAYRLSVADVRSGSPRPNENVSAGLLVEGGQELLIQGIGRVRTTADIARRSSRSGTASRSGSGNLGRRPDRRGHQAGRGLGPGQARRHPRHPEAAGGQHARPDARCSTRRSTRSRRRSPQGMKIDRHSSGRRTSSETASRTSSHALRDGGILVVLVVLLFLANFRASVITLLAIPLSLITAVLVLKALGATINTMTLGGMAIAIGELVDDAIIDVENVFRRLRENAHLPAGRAAKLRSRSSIARASRSGPRSSSRPSSSCSCSSRCSSSRGVEGRLLQPLGVAYIVSLFASLVVALTLTPALCSLLLPNSKAVLSEHEPWVVRSLKSWLCPGPRSHPPASRRWSLVPALAALRPGAASMPLHGPGVPARVQRGGPDDQCGDPAGDLARRNPTSWAGWSRTASSRTRR